MGCIDPTERYWCTSEPGRSMRTKEDENKKERKGLKCPEHGLFVFVYTLHNTVVHAGRDSPHKYQ